MECRKRKDGTSQSCCRDTRAIQRHGKELQSEAIVGIDRRNHASNLVLVCWRHEVRKEKKKQTRSPISSSPSLSRTVYHQTGLSSLQFRQQAQSGLGSRIVEVGVDRQGQRPGIPAAFLDVIRGDVEELLAIQRTGRLLQTSVAMVFGRRWQDGELSAAVGRVRPSEPDAVPQAFASGPCTVVAGREALVAANLAPYEKKVSRAGLSPFKRVPRQTSIVRRINQTRRDTTLGRSSRMSCRQAEECQLKGICGTKARHDNTR